MTKATTSSTSGADVIVILLDATSVTDTDYKIIAKYQNVKIPVFVVINKLDISKDEKLFPILSKLNEFKFVQKFFTISALKRKKLDILVADLANVLPEGEPLYPTDTYTDRPIKFIATEVIREKALLYLQQEIPHGIAIELQKYLEGNTKTTIFADIICESERHKQIIIGAGGSMLKNIGSAARKELEKILDTHVTLKLFVKVKPDWKDNKQLLSTLGYDDKDL
jgi:GTP-binding protein Era